MPQSRTGQIRLDAARTAAVAEWSRTLLAIGPGQGIVPPLSRDPVHSGEHVSADHDPAASAGTDNDAENDRGAGPCTVRRFRQREAVRVVGEAYLTTEASGQIAGQRRSIEPRRVRVLDAPARGRDRAGNADANRSVRTGLTL